VTRGGGVGVSRLRCKSLLNGKAGSREIGRCGLRRSLREDGYADADGAAYEIAQTRKREKLIRVRRVLRAA